jgi:ribonuclease HI
MVAEAWGAFLAIQMCKTMRFSKVHFKGDTKMVVDAINIGKVDRSSLGLLVDDIRSELDGMP